MPKPKTAPETTSIRIAVQDRSALDHLKAQLMAQSDHEVVSILAHWALTDPTALTQLRRASPRWKQAARPTEGGVYIDPRAGSQRKVPAGGLSEIDALLADI